MYYRHDGMGTGGWILMITGMVVFWTLVAILIFTLIRYVNQAPHAHSHRHETISGTPVQTPEQILAERFARGEIDEAGYRQRSHALDETRGGSR